MRDNQTNRVYDWEDCVVAPRDRSEVAFANAQSVINHIWAGEGLQYPPMAEPLPYRRDARSWALSTRLAIKLPETVPSWVIIHEVAHSMTSTMGGDTDGHGPEFLGNYVRLLDRYAGIPSLMLMHSLNIRGIAYNMFAKPSIIDKC